MVQLLLPNIQQQTFTASKTHKEKTMTTLTKIVVDCSTGAIEEIELTTEELAQREANAAAFAAEQHEKEAAAAEAAEAKAALLAKLGITEDEAKLLLA